MNGMVAIFLAVTTACSVPVYEVPAYGGGNTIPVAVTESKDSIMYTQDEIQDAITVIQQDFAEEFDGCTLTSIAYAGDEVSQKHIEWAERNHADEVIVLISSFDVDASGGDGSLNPNSTYDDWLWILVRNNGGTWQHVDHGY